MSNEAPEEEKEPQVLNAPPKIYLCLGDEDVSDVDFKELTEVSWSDDKSTVHTVEYIRSDIAQAQTNKAVREVLRAIKEVMKPYEKEDWSEGLDTVDAAIDSILNEYPDLLTNEEKTV